MWARETEIHEEKAYSPEELTAYLQQVGFTQIRQYGNRKLRPPRDGGRTDLFTARKAETTE